MNAILFFLEEFSVKVSPQLFSHAVPSKTVTTPCQKMQNNLKQKQPPRGVPRKKCYENMQQIYRRTPMPKCDFNKVPLQLY